MFLCLSVSLSLSLARALADSLCVSLPLSLSQLQGSKMEQETVSRLMKAEMEAKAQVDDAKKGTPLFLPPSLGPCSLLPAQAMGTPPAPVAGRPRLFSLSALLSHALGRLACFHSGSTVCVCVCVCVCA